MILSHQHRFIFIKGVKVAGTSAEIALSQVCGPNDIITPITPADERARLGTAGEPRNYASRWLPFRARRERQFVERVRSAADDELRSVKPPRGPFHNHMPLKDVLARVPAARLYDVVCVERSPYAKVMSMANWSKHKSEYYKGEKLASSGAAIAAAVDEIIANGKIRDVLNIGRYRDAGGMLRARAWKTESLAGDMASFLKERGLPSVALVHAKKGVQSDKLAPEQALRPDQIETINRLFAEEFDCFGWERIQS